MSETFKVTYSIQGQFVQDVEADRIEDIDEHILYIDTFPAVNNVNGYIKIVDIERYE